MSAVPVIAQLKMHRHFGGGEVYARFLCQAFAGLGWPNLLVTHPQAGYWDRLTIPAPTARAEAMSAQEAFDRIPAGIPVISHAPLDPALVRRVGGRNPMIGIVHMPFTGEADSFRGYERVFAVSRHVAHSLQQRGVTPWPEPLLGVADFQRGEAGDAAQPICRRSEFDWDRRKVRDRLLGWSEPAWSLLRPHRRYTREAGVFTLGVVSRITTIKKFPELFRCLTPVLQGFPQVQVEFFGAGGYAQVRDLRRALRPLGGRVRFWGHQSAIETIYRSVDCVLSGLPEREALGLNLIEAQQLGTPVAAVDAPPFTETVAHGVTGWLYPDPRTDGGAGFADLLQGLVSGQRALDRARAAEHLAQFSMPAFMQRLQRGLGPWLP